MARAMAAALTVLLFSAGQASAQDTLTVGQPVNRAITAGATHQYTIALEAGDYVVGAVDQRGIVVLAAVFAPDGSRLRNFGGPPAGKRTLAFIAERAGTYRLELRAPSVADAAQQGGSQTETYAGLRHPEVFGNVLCQSGSFWWAPDHSAFPDMDATTETGWLAKEFIKSPKLPLRFWMDAGVFEVDSRGTGGGILEPSRHMRDVLLAKGYEVHYQQFNSGHDYLNWRGTLADGLIALVGTDTARPPTR